MTEIQLGGSNKVQGISSAMMPYIVQQSRGQRKPEEELKKYILLVSLLIITLVVSSVASLRSTGHKSRGWVLSSFMSIMVIHGELTPWILIIFVYHSRIML